MSYSEDTRRYKKKKKNLRVVGMTFKKNIVKKLFSAIPIFKMTI